MASRNNNNNNSDSEHEDEDSNNKDDSNKKDDNKKALVVCQKTKIADMIRDGQIIPDELLEEVMAHNGVEEDAVSLNIDLSKAVGNEEWEQPPLYWTGESMKPSKMGKVLFGSKFVHLKEGPHYLTEQEAGKPKA